MYPYLRWAYNYPDGKDRENCVEMYASELREFNDISCLRQSCAICDIPRRPTIYVRGNCPDTVLDTR